MDTEGRPMTGGFRRYKRPVSAIPAIGQADKESRAAGQRWRRSQCRAGAAATTKARRPGKESAPGWRAASRARTGCTSQQTKSALSVVQHCLFSAARVNCRKWLGFSPDTAEHLKLIQRTFVKTRCPPPLVCLWCLRTPPGLCATIDFNGLALPYLVLCFRPAHWPRNPRVTLPGPMSNSLAPCTPG